MRTVKPPPTPPSEVFSDREVEDEGQMNTLDLKYVLWSPSGSCYVLTF